jgi:MYXO-CTERM domain-containing protein
VIVPGGTSCQNCTLRLRQIMGATPSTCTPTTVGSQGTYFSCADLRIIADGGTPSGGDGGTSSGGDAGTSGTGDDSGTGPGSGDSGSGSGDNGDTTDEPGEFPNQGKGGGCSVTSLTSNAAPWGSAGGLALGIVLGLSRLRRRKR